MLVVGSMVLEQGVRSCLRRSVAGALSSEGDVTKRCLRAFWNAWSTVKDS